MEKLINFFMANLALIAAIFAFVTAAAIIIAVVIVSVKNHGTSRENARLENSSEKAEENPEEETEEPASDGEASDEELAAETDETTDEVEKDKGANTDMAKTAKENPTEKKVKEVTAPKATVKAAPKAEAKTATKAAPKAVAQKSDVKATPKKAEAKNAPAKEERKIVGKWIIKEKGEGEFVAYLYANNGTIILTSEIYTSEDSARKGVETIRKNMSDGSLQYYKDKNGNYYFKLKSVKNRILCVGETYKTRELCESAAESVKRFAESPVAEGVEKDITVIKYVLPKKEEKIDERSAYSGKWKIEDDDGTYMAKLFASNGELLLNSESYVSYDSAESAIATITANGIAGNFIIDSDKKGRYFFKLRSAQKATLCIGETYAQLSACQSAIESVRRFLKTAKLVAPGD